MKKKLFFSMFMAIAMISMCSMLASCGDDDDNDPTPDPKPEKTITSGTFTYLVAFNKDVTEWADISLTLTASPGTSQTISLNDSLTRSLNELMGYETFYLDKGLLTGLGKLDNYALYSVPVKVSAFPANVTVKYTWKMKEGYQPQPGKVYDIVQVETYGLEASPTQIFSGSQKSSRTSINYDKLDQYINHKTENSTKKVKLTVEDNTVLFTQE